VPTLFKDKKLEPLLNRIEALDFFHSKITYGDTLEIDTEYGFDENSEVYKIAKELIPWRKGPFRIDKFKIESEWNSYVKFNILAKNIDLSGKTVLDIGSNNCYYSFKMLPYSPKKIIAVEPWPLFYLQYLFINKFVQTDRIEFGLYGLEEMEDRGIKADTVFCLGILYHRKDPITALKSIKGCMNNGGELFIDNLIISGDDFTVLSPPISYAKMTNAYFIPTVNAMKGWLERAGFCEIELIETKKTDFFEQRKTEWITGLSLDNFLDPNDLSKTVEGFEAPTRAYFKCRRIDGKR